MRGDEYDKGSVRVKRTNDFWEQVVGRHRAVLNLEPGWVADDGPLGRGSCRSEKVPTTTKDRESAPRCWRRARSVQQTLLRGGQAGRSATIALEVEKTPDWPGGRASLKHHLQSLGAFDFSRIPALERTVPGNQVPKGGKVERMATLDVGRRPGVTREGRTYQGLMEGWIGELEW